MNPDEKVKLETIELERMRFAVQTMVSRNLLEEGFQNPPVLEFLVDRITQNLVAEFQVHVAGKKLDTFIYKHPETWWEGWKEALYRWLSWQGGGHMPWLGDYLKKRYPVRMHIVEYDTRVLYPSIPIKDMEYRIYVKRLDRTEPWWKKNEDQDV